MNYIEKVQGYSPIAYWPMNEAAGNFAFDYSGNGHTGTYSGVTLGQAGIGDGETCPFFDGANDFCDIESDALKSAFNGATGTMVLWLQVADAGVWTDGTARRAWNMQASGNNNIRFERRTANNVFRVIYQANAVNEIVDITMSDTDWFCIALTWDKAADAVKIYKGGVQQGATQTGLGVWGGSFLNMVIGATSIVPSDVWNGKLAHAQIYDYVLTPDEIAGVSIPAVSDTYWGHITGVVENPRTFVNNWAGSATIVGSGDGEQVCISAAENMISEVVDTGLYTVELVQNIYDGTGDDVTLSYRHSGTVAGCQAASFVPYSVPFSSLGFVQVRTTPS